MILQSSKDGGFEIVASTKTTTLWFAFAAVSEGMNIGNL
jgi:hypothetical protein